jgi:hypothetical protein
MNAFETAGSDSKQKFENARFKSLLNSLKFFLIGRENELLSFDKIKKGLGLRNQRYLGIKAVAVDDIVGSVDRYKDFDRYFLPKKTFLMQRWANIHGAFSRDIGLPLVQLYKVGNIYFVVDGNHRVSVAKNIGARYIDAEITEFITKTPVTREMDPKDMFLLAEREKFLDLTKLKKNRPDAKINITIPGKYDFLLQQINKLMNQLNEGSEKKINFEEASLYWYDNIYLPAIDIINHYRIMENFPSRTKSDLYVWINEHKRYLSLKYGRPTVLKFAAKDFSRKYKEKSWLRLKLKIISLKYKIFSKLITKPPGS